MTASHFICMMLLSALGACSSQPVAAQNDGKLIVYSATYAATVEQSEYPVHTNYTIASTDDKVIERVANNTGSFFSKPATVALPSGKYHVRAQNVDGRFVVVPVVIETGKTTVVHLDDEAPPY
jgi:hypothetical protein